jgi:diguanylate cyclase (GGDEF)-like protein
VVKQLDVNHRVFEDSQIRNGYTAMSDVHRLTETVKEAVVQGAMSPELAANFEEAADILYVRADNFRRMRAKGIFLPSGETSIQSLEHVVDIADRAISSNFADLDAFAGELLEASGEARSHLVMFLDDMRRQVDEVLLEQSLAVRKQQAVVICSLIGLTLVGCIALLFLRREVLGRRARAKAEQRVEFLAFFDPLTRLPNRVQFQDRLQNLLEGNRPVALLFIDLDDFKVINDTHGHAAGDEALRHVARVLASAAKDYDGFAARLAGDEYAMVVPISERPRLEQLCRRVIKDAALPFTFDGKSSEVSLSIGIATSQQVSVQSAATLDMLSRVTDFALYASKMEGRRRYTFYDHRLEQQFFERRAMLDELPRAIEQGDLEVFLQPKVSLPDGRTFGFEALVRWRRNGVLVQPGQFILLAEESGLVLDIDCFVLNQSARLIAAWNERHGTNFSVSVNLSALHFNSSKIVETVEHALWRSDLQPENLTLEITETTEMRDWKQAQKIIHRLHKLGCKIAIDDFGTGFSSLAYLRSTLADELKIDRSLIDELENSEKARLLLSSVFEIARNLEMAVTVEGIENRAQAEIICSMGAANAQGYLFGHPKPPTEALEAATRDYLPEHSLKTVL